MTAPAYLDYFYGDEVKIDSFYRLPRVFLTNEFYSDIPTEVAVLYGLMLDRVALSMRNGWREPDGRVFIYFTLKDAIRLLNVGKNKAVSLFRQMEKLDLIRRRKQGQGKPARVFVRTFVEAAPENADAPAPDCAEPSETPPPSVTPPMAAPECENREATPIMEAAFPAEASPMPEPTRETIPTPVHDVKRPATPVEETPEAVRNGLAGLLNECAVGVRRLGNILAQRLTNGGGVPMNAGNAAGAAPDVRKESAGKPIIQSYVRDLAYEGDRWRNVSLIRSEIKENIDFSIINRDNFEMMEQLFRYMDIMVDACCGQTPTVRINGSEYSRAMVRKRMYELDATHLEYVYDCMRECAPKVRNIRAYVLTALFNSYDTIDIYYEAKVSHDMAVAHKRAEEKCGVDFDGD